NTVVGGDKTINLSLSNAKGGATLGNISTSTINIKDDDVGGTIQFSSAGYTVGEGVGTMAVMVTRTGGNASGVSIDYATVSGTAKEGLDFKASSGTLTFATGETSKMFNVTIIDDSIVEGDETLTLTLANPKG